jgi:glutamate synthase (NADPH/NADH) large chain/glutamate synthase (ferredoxin)
MTGGMAYVYDPDGIARDYMNMETLVACPVTHPHWQAELKALIERHHAETGSLKAARILASWETEQPRFVQACPKEMLPHIAHPLDIAAEAVPAE